MKLHKLAPGLRRALAVTLSATMALGLTACQQALDVSENCGYYCARCGDGGGSRNCCGGSGDRRRRKQRVGVRLSAHGGERNEQVVMNDQPESSYWFPEQLLEWNPQEDPDLAYNVSTVPLAQRTDMESLRTVNSTQNRRPK